MTPFPVPTCCIKHWEEENKDSPVRHLGMAMMFLCKVCGNKRCPKATDCSLECTHSNEPGQKCSVYE